jgi:hypothetical protein
MNAGFGLLLVCLTAAETEPLVALQRFPSSEVADVNHCTVYAHRERMAKTLGIERVGAWPLDRDEYVCPLAINSRERLTLIEMYRQAVYADECWSHLRVAQNVSTPGRSLYERIEALEGLWNLLGPVDWAAGQMPPPLPLWLFRGGDR